MTAYHLKKRNFISLLGINGTLSKRVDETILVGSILNRVDETMLTENNDVMLSHFILQLR